MICRGCGSEIRRTYSIASSDEDDYLATCDCPTDWGEVAIQFLVIVTFLGLVVLGVWCKG